MSDPVERDDDLAQIRADARRFKEEAGRAVEQMGEEFVRDLEESLPATLEMLHNVDLEQFSPHLRRRMAACARELRQAFERLERRLTT